MNKKLFIVRHGQTDYNRQRLVQGRNIDAPLNQHGMQQAQHLHAAYKDFPFHHCFTSSLQRTVQTVGGFLHAGLPFSQHAGLDEMDYGIYEGQSIDHFRCDDLSVMDISNLWEEGRFEIGPKGGETLFDVQARERVALQEILAHPAEHILICMHSRAIRVLLCTLLELPFDAMKTFVPSNTGVTRVDYDVHAGKATLVSFDDTDHLAPMRTASR